MPLTGILKASAQYVEWSKKCLWHSGVEAILDVHVAAELNALLQGRITPLIDLQRSTSDLNVEVGEREIRKGRIDVYYEFNGECGLIESKRYMTDYGGVAADIERIRLIADAARRAERAARGFVIGPMYLAKDETDKFRQADKYDSQLAKFTSARTRTHLGDAAKLPRNIANGKLELDRHYSVVVEVLA